MFFNGQSNGPAADDAGAGSSVEARATRHRTELNSEVLSSSESHVLQCCVGTKWTGGHDQATNTRVFGAGAATCSQTPPPELQSGDQRRRQETAVWKTPANDHQTIEEGGEGKEHLFQWSEPWCKTPSLSFSNICTLISQSVSQLSSGTNLTGVGSRTQLTICSVLSLMSSSFWTSPVYLIYLDSLSLSLFLIHLRVGQTELASSSRRQQVDVWSC